MSNIFDEFLDELAAAEGLSVNEGEGMEADVTSENNETENTDTEDNVVTESEEDVTETGEEDTVDNTVDEGTDKTDPTVDENSDVTAEESVIEIDPDEFLTEGLESALLLDTLKETCTKEEFKNFIAENKTDLELYGLVNFAAMATESLNDDEDTDVEGATEARNIVRLNKQAQISREEARISIGLAKKCNDSLYKYYKKYADLKRTFRDKIYAKYNGRARGLARKAVMNSRNKASVMNSKTGSTIINKIDARIKDLDSKGRNNEAVKKPAR